MLYNCCGPYLFGFSFFAFIEFFLKKTRIGIFCSQGMTVANVCYAVFLIVSKSVLQTIPLRKIK
jgi:hypothetical protein